jgi:hypothetical protein
MLKTPAAARILSRGGCNKLKNYVLSLIKNSIFEVLRYYSHTKGFVRERGAIDLIVELIEGVAKDVLNLEEGESLDIKGSISGALTEVGLKELAGFFKTSKKLSNKLDRLEKLANKDIKKAQKEIDRGSTKVKYKNRVDAGNKKINAIKTTREFLDIPKSAFGEAGSNVEYKDGKISKKKG